MESTPNNPILKYNPDTLQFLRHQYGFDTTKRVKDAIDILKEWILKQEHFEKKHFDRDYLERLLIYNKGSVEKCKKKLDKLCTLRTLLPDYFCTKPFDKELLFPYYHIGLLSHMTADHGRIFIAKVRGDKFTSEIVTHCCKYIVLIFEYILMKDYCNHVTLILELSEANMLQYTKALDLFEYRKFCEVALLGFSLRIKAFHLITPSKSIDVFLTLVKPFLGPKLSSRIQIHKTIDDLNDHIPRYILPQDYDGKDKSLSQLREELYNELHSNEFTEYRNEMNEARTNEMFRQKDKFNEDHLGISGTFRSMTVD